MPFVKNIEQFRSVSIVGIAKNTGKTTCLNYVIRRLREEQKSIAITSIGLDGEERDVLYHTPKPRIVLHEGMVFVTTENDFVNAEFPASTLAVSERSTLLGRLVTARALGSGKIVISGPSDSTWLHEVITGMDKYGVALTLVDGAFSRMSLASPAVTDAMILCTGAACSGQLAELIRRTKFRCRLIDLPQVENSFFSTLFPLETNVWQMNEQTGETCKIAGSVFTFTGEAEKLVAEKAVIYVSGAVTEQFLKTLCNKKYNGIKLIVRDFSKLFVQQGTFDRFVRRGGQVEVLQKAKLLGVCTNPTSPDGARFDAVLLRNEMEKALQLPVYDIVQIENENDAKK